MSIVMLPRAVPNPTVPDYGPVTVGETWAALAQEKVSADRLLLLGTLLLVLNRPSVFETSSGWDCPLIHNQ